MPKFQDLHKLSEDERIRTIGERAMASGKLTAVCVDNWPGKAERYKQKLHAQFPELTIGETMRGPVPATVMFRVIRRAPGTQPRIFTMEPNDHVS